MIDPQQVVDLWLDASDEVQDTSWWECTCLSQMDQFVAEAVRSFFGGVLIERCSGYSVSVLHQDGGMTVLSGEGVFDYPSTATPLNIPRTVIYLDEERGARAAWGAASAVARITAYTNILARLRPSNRPA